jgi:hypothetical protein
MGQMENDKRGKNKSKQKSTTSRAKWIVARNESYLMSMARNKNIHVKLALGQGLT